MSLSLSIPAGYSKDVQVKTARKHKRVENDDQVLRQVVKAASKLDHGNLSPCPEAFEYFPHSGPQQVACYLLSLPHMKQALQALSMSIFESGPHKLSKGATQLKLDHPYDFGHYNLRFVQWLKDTVVPVLTRPTVVKATQGKYNQTLLSFMSTLHLTLKKIDDEPDCFATEVQGYRRYIEAKRSGTFNESQHPELPYERYFYFMNRHFCSNPQGGFDFFSERGHAGDDDVDGNMVKGCVSWWIRRTLDGSAPLFKEIVREIVKVYHPPAQTDKTVIISHDEDQALALLQSFKAIVRARAYVNLMDLLHPLYIQKYHDKKYKGNTQRFLEYFFCGEATDLKDFECLDISRITELKFQSLDRTRGLNNWYAQYLTSGYKMSSDELTTIKLEIMIVRVQQADGSYQYKLVGNRK